MNHSGKFFGKIVLSLVIVPVATLVLGEAFTHLYNITLDAGIVAVSYTHLTLPTIYSV